MLLLKERKRSEKHGPLTNGTGYYVKTLTRRISCKLRKENGRMLLLKERKLAEHHRATYKG